MRRSYIIAIAVCLLLACSAAAKSADARHYRYEAEEGELTNVEVASANRGYSGTGYVTKFDSASDRLTVRVDVPSGMYEVWVSYQSPAGIKKYGIQVGDERAESSFDRTSNSFAEDCAGVFEVSAGTKTIEILNGWGYFNIDYVELREAAIHPPAPIAPQLADPNADEPTRLLMNYLCSVYGRQTLAGQQGPLTEAYLQKSGGRQPAISGFDLMDYSPSRRERGVDPGDAVEQRIAWAQRHGGIVTLSWHWNAPADLIDEPGGREWWSGFNTKATAFDVAAALADPNSPNFALLIRDIDAIAAELKKFADADIPVLWRPLHEAEGKWFWWGAKGPDPFVKLWRLLFDRLTTTHKLHNLIWVYTSSPAEMGFEQWYPGDDVVDVVGVDVYADGSASFRSAWSDLLPHYDGRKLIALTEAGALPDPKDLRKRGVGWSWFLPWSLQRSMTSSASGPLDQVLGDADVITLDELPAFPWKSDMP